MKRYRHSLVLLICIRKRWRTSMTFKSNRRRWLGVAAALTLGVSALGWARVTQAADDWPERAVSLVVPFPAGGPGDTAARFVVRTLAGQGGGAAGVGSGGG